MYKKAVAQSDNSLTAPMYLKKMGLAYEALGNYTEAIAAYKTIEEQYPASMEGRDIAKFIGAAEQLQ
jgi:tetratricopeptide (TPR) repeat protein